MKILLKIAIVAVAAAFMAGCCNCRSYQKKTRRPLAGTEWQLIQLGGKAVKPEEGKFTVTLLAEGNRLTGVGACNRAPCSRPGHDVPGSDRRLRPAHRPTASCPPKRSGRLKAPRTGSRESCTDERSPWKSQFPWTSARPIKKGPDASGPFQFCIARYFRCEFRRPHSPTGGRMPIAITSSRSLQRCS